MYGWGMLGGVWVGEVGVWLKDVKWCMGEKKEA